MLTFKQIEALYWTVKLGTFAAAAQKLHTTQSAITKRIQELEADFDIALFDRSGYRAELTSRGHEVYAMAEQMLAHRDRLLVRLKGQHTLTGTFRFGITEITAMTWLPALIRLLRTNYPRIALEPHIDLGRDLQKRLHAGQLDMAFLHGEFADAELQVVPLQRLEFAWMGSPDLIDPSRVYTPRNIAALPLLRQSRDSGLNMIYDGWLKPYTPASNMFTINSLIAMAGLTAAGFGISCLPRDYFAGMVSARQLVIARTSTAPPQSLYCAMFRPQADVAFCESVASLARSCCDFSSTM
jgi:DNA-binding transcriptional LysR family regulator